VEVEHLPKPAGRIKKTLWLWWSGDGQPDLDLCWRAYLRRFDIEHCVARNFPNTSRSKSRQVCRSTSPIRRVLGSEAPTRTPMDSSANIFRRALTCRDGPLRTLRQLLTHSTPDHERSLRGRRRPKHSKSIYAWHSKQVLLPLVESGQFTSWAFTENVRRYGLLGSMGTVGDCYDNSPMESFWGSMQIELLNRQRWMTVVELSVAMANYIENFYNLSRRHSSLQYFTPSEFEKLNCIEIQTSLA